MDTAVNPKKANRQRRLPRTDADLLATAKRVSQKWAESDWLTFKWISQSEFQAVVEAFDTAFAERQLIGSARPAVTAALLHAGIEMNRGVKFIKAYLFEKYGTVAHQHYHSFGLVPISEAMRLPHDREQRCEALKILLRAIEEEGFAARPYGKAYWTEKNKAYHMLLQQAKSIDGNISLQVCLMSQYRKTIVRGMESILFALKAHYPDTYKAEIRNWGFHKEKY